MVSQNETIDYLLATAKRDNGVDWKQLFYQSQIIYGENVFSTFVKKLESYANMASQVKYFINSDYVEEVQEMITNDVMTYIYSIAAKSSEHGGELLNIISTESKRLDYNIFGSEKGKPDSMFKKVQKFDRSKITEGIREERNGMRDSLSDFKT